MGEAIMETLKSGSAYTLLRERIIEGDYTPGQTLKGVDLIADIGFGPTPLREALTRLEAESFVVASSHRGFSVAPMTISRLKDLGKTQLILETALILDAMAAGDEAYDSEIIAAHHRLSRMSSPEPSSDSDTILRWSEAHQAFHMSLLAGANAPWQRHVWAATTDHLSRYHHHLLKHRDGLEDKRLFADVLTLKPHTELMEAVLKRKKKTLRAVMEEHVNASTRAFARVAEQNEISRQG
jgi:GntR family carbon starvation induced transcriptional regulator